MTTMQDMYANNFWANVTLQMQLATLNLKSDVTVFQTSTESLGRLHKIIRAQNQMYVEENEVLQNRIDRLKRYHALHSWGPLSGRQPPEVPFASESGSVTPDMDYAATGAQGMMQQGIARQDAIPAELLPGAPRPQPSSPAPSGTAAEGWGACAPEGRPAGHPLPAAGGAGDAMSNFAGEVLTCAQELCRFYASRSTWQHQEHLLSGLVSLVDNMPPPELQQPDFGPPLEEAVPLPRFGAVAIAAYRF
eukprot:CAMPEP_0179063746 /NCGR_PEP_ID=MMETSP0796-20121207/27596_1 /TAXON_ID=73915 /ORGANISM="Pyrodinium bahamense, Strain pbaha01" /LENGTH=247 /DNA_ID=CAMNT_0020760681 /DNA_START=28 /DNA_END=771 /DNA_ORIENTATION=+